MGESGLQDGYNLTRSGTVQFVFKGINLMGLLLGQENVISATVKEEKVTLCEGFRAF